MLKSLLNNSDPDAPRLSSVLTRVLPLSKRTGRTFDFDIELDAEHKVYRPGEVVSGHVKLYIFKGTDLTHLTASLHGYAQVFKHAVIPGETKAVPESLINGKGCHEFEFHGNGLASLFQDEIVLCGAGFLTKGEYTFSFNLRFPEYSLPSTIDFEKGQVNYIVSGTCTRPTTIAPTFHKFRKVKFLDKIDVSTMQNPRIRAINLDPIRRGKSRRLKIPESGSLSSQLSTSTAHTSTNVSSNPPPSPALSQETATTSISASSHGQHDGRNLKDQAMNGVPSVPSSHRSSVDRAVPNKGKQRADDHVHFDGVANKRSATAAQSIYASVEIPTHGALPGDLVPVHIRVQHTQENAKGIVIATLFREGRIDMHPHLPLARRDKDKKPEYEDVYGKSKTGLGGLYFTQNTPNMQFRKELSQKSTMMFVNPKTKTAEFTINLRIPSDAFPSMTNIQGQMIQFEYKIEVVIDLLGKLNETRLLPSLTSTGPAFTPSQEMDSMNLDGNNSILDTAPLRRIRNVPTFKLPMIVGTHDTGRADRRKRANGLRLSHPGSDHHTGNAWRENDYLYDRQAEENSDYNHPHQHSTIPWQSPDTEVSRSPFRPPAPRPYRFTDEKGRLRNEEATFLPSQLLREHERSTVTGRTAAPPLTLVTNTLGRGQDGIRTGTSPPIPITSLSGRSDSTPHEPLTPPPSLPDDAPDILNASDDKRELEMRRLQALASSPPAEDSDDESPTDPSSVSRQVATAPPISAFEDDYTAHTLQRCGDALPRYQK